MTALALQRPSETCVVRGNNRSRYIDIFVSDVLAELGEHSEGFDNLKPLENMAW